MLMTATRLDHAAFHNFFGPTLGLTLTFFQTYSIKLEIHYPSARSVESGQLKLRDFV